MNSIGEFFTSSAFLTIVEVAVIVGLAGLLIWRSQKNKKSEELRKQALARVRDEELSRLLSNDLGGRSPEGGRSVSGGKTVRITVSGPGGSRTEVFPEGQEIVVGRDPSCGLHLESRYVGRRQCVLFWEGSMLLAGSTDATNPTVIRRGGETIRVEGEKTALREGDVMTVGDIRLEIRFSGR